MDMCMIDLTDKPGWMWAASWSCSGTGSPWMTCPDWQGPFPYEITCNISKRVPRVYMEDGKVIGRELLLRM